MTRTRLRISIACSRSRSLVPCLRALFIILPTLLLLSQLTCLASEPREASPPPGPTSRLEMAGREGVALDFTPGDCSGDGYDELLIWGSPQEGTTDVLRLWLYDNGFFTQATQVSFKEGKIADCRVADLQRDGKPEVILARVGQTTCWFEVYRYDGHDLRLVTTSKRMQLPDRDRSGRWEGNLRVETVFDQDSDGVLDLVCSFGSGYDMWPRGVWIFSGRTFAAIDSVPTAGPIDHAKRVMLCEGRTPADAVMLIPTNAPGNGNRVGPFSDSLNYLIAVDGTCGLLWYMNPVAKPHVWDYGVCEADSDGVPEVIVTADEPAGGAAIDHEVRALDLRTGIEERFLSLPSNARGICAGDLNRDTRSEIVVAMTDGRVQVLNGDLSVLASRVFGAGLDILEITDVDLDGSPDILVRCGGEAAYVLDSKLNIIASREFPTTPVPMKISRPASDRRYIHALAAGEIMNLRMLPVEGLPLRVAGGGWRAFVLLLAAGLVLGLALGIWISWARSRTSMPGRREMRSRQVRDQLLAALCGFDHSGTALSSLQRLAQYCEVAPDQDGARYTEYTQRLGSIVGTYRDFTRGLLQEIAGLCTRLDGDGIDPCNLNKVVGELNRLIGDGETPEGRQVAMVHYGRSRAQAISRNAIAVLTEVKALRRSLLDSYRVDVNAAVCRVIAATGDRLADHGVGRLSVSFEGQAVGVGDEEGFKRCLEIIMINAAEAMSGRDRREVLISVRVGNGSAVVRVEDTGSGIPREEWEHIFDRGVSTRGLERGLGLYHARQTLAKYGATIHVESSTPGKGATFAMRLRAVTPHSPGASMGGKVEAGNSSGSIKTDQPDLCPSQGDPLDSHA